jgi:hypothetical protein
LHGPAVTLVRRSERIRTEYRLHTFLLARHMETRIRAALGNACAYPDRYTKVHVRYRDRAFGSLERPLQIQAVLGFWSQPEKRFSVLALLQSLIGAIFQPKPVNWWLFFGFSPFTSSGSARDALRAYSGHG